MKSHKLRAAVLGTTAALVVAEAVGAAVYILRVPQLGLDVEPATPLRWIGAGVLALIVAGTIGWLAVQLARTAASAGRDSRAGGRPLGSLAVVVAAPLIIVNVVVALGMLPRLYHGPGVGLLVMALAVTAVGLAWSARGGGLLRSS